MSETINPFASRDAADRYARYRPDYSHELAGVLADTVGPAAMALDVAAGTGIATRAVATVAERVVCVDASPDMVAAGRPPPGVRCLIAGAEALPFRPATFDLVCVGSALHWFHRDAFVSQAARVTTPGARLVVHDHGFTGQMEEVTAFTAWMHRRYLRGYPAPPRGEKLAPGSDLGPFRFGSTHRYEQAVAMTRDDLAGYLTTQSNLQVVMTSRHNVDEVLAWLEQELTPFFEDAPTRRMLFAGMATVLRKSE